MSAASSFRFDSSTLRISAFTVRFPNATSITSPTFTSADAFAGRPFTVTLPASQASFDTVRLLMILETFRYLSIRMLLLCFLFFEGASYVHFQTVNITKRDGPKDRPAV